MLPALGQLKVREVRRRYIKPWLSSLKQRGLAPDTVRLAKAALSALLSHATDEELIDTNPALQLGRMKGAHAGKLTKADREEHIRPFESVQQRDEFLNAAAKYRPDAAAFEVMAKAGLRPGEAYALQPDDLNLKMRTMRVERALDLDKTVKRTKTYERRTVRLSSSLVQSLKRHLIWLKSQALVRGWVEVQWLFPTEVNTPLDESRAKKVFAPVGDQPSLPPPLRPSSHLATLMLMGGANPGYVSRQLGHKNPATTFRHYYEWIPSEDDHRWTDILEPDSGTKTPSGTPLLRKCPM